MENLIKCQIGEWESKCNHLKSLIDDYAKVKDYKSAYHLQIQLDVYRKCQNDLYLLLDNL